MTYTTGRLGASFQLILSYPLMAVAVDLVTDENAAPSITRVPNDATPDGRAQYSTWHGRGNI